MINKGDVKIAEDGKPQSPRAIADGIRDEKIHR